MWSSLVATLVGVCLAIERYDDFHYPSEEPHERADIEAQRFPVFQSVNETTCTIAVGGASWTGTIGELWATFNWRVVAVLPSVGSCVLERSFNRWGVVVTVPDNVVLRKSIGLLPKIEQPYFNFTGTDPDYFSKLESADNDYASELASKLAADGEADFASLAAVLAPQRDMVEVSNAADVVKFVVTYNGRVKCGAWDGNSIRGITEFADLHAPMPNNQTIIFDPADHLKFWPSRFEHTKTGLVGGHLRIANVGSYSATEQRGFELLAFSPIFKADGREARSQDGPPRIADINYKPGVFVRLREESGSDFGAFQYFYASNETLRAADTKEFYTALIEYQRFYDAASRHEMVVTLPDGDRRQVDMARSGLLAASNNYIGNQPNYGNGGTYWSVAHKDNGSLPLNILSVDEAALEWGLCEMALAHIGFYFENYVRPDGSINYYTWGALGDSLGDIGRLASLYIKAVQLCSDPETGGDAAWADAYLPVAERFANWMLKKRDEAVARGAVPPEAKGLVIGAPEHDWSKKGKDKAFFSNNVMILRGMEELGAFFLEVPSRNSTLGRLLLDAAVDFRSDIASSVAACVAEGSPAFLPPYATKNFKPFAHMTGGDAASYSNFRFYPEVLQADVLPRNVENALLTWHNGKGGRLAGASRFDARLDDMPSAGWGYGALLNNRSDDFLALLYGHMATYQSRGSFHATEQLSFKGEGYYRDFLWWNEPTPGGWSCHHWSKNESSAIAAGGAKADVCAAGGNVWTHGDNDGKLGCGTCFCCSPPSAQALAAQGEPQPGYYRNENDVSFCIVTEVLTARLTRWQLVLEDFYRNPDAGAIWLARGAPTRWFQPSQLFSVRNAPTRFGRLSYEVKDGVYNVTTPKHAPAKLQWKLRWPTALTNARCDGCTILEVGADGIVTVLAISSTFTVSDAGDTSVEWV